MASRLRTEGLRALRRFLVVPALVLSAGDQAVRAANVPSRITVEPIEVHLTGMRSRQQVAVTGVFEDGSVRDMTAEATFAVDEEKTATATRAGVVLPRGEGHTRLIVRAAGQVAEASVMVHSARSDRGVSFRVDVVALLAKAGCNMGACHGNLNGKGGFRLSLRGDDPGFDWKTLTRDALGRRVDPYDPECSLIIQKPTGRLPHEGGLRFARGSQEESTLREWVAGGAKDDAATAPRLARLFVFPAERICAAPSRSQQLVVTAEFVDGTRRDVTREASYDVSDPTQASISADGRVEVKRPIETTIAVRYLGGRGVSRLAFLADRPDFVWQGGDATGPVDTHVFAKLKALKINPSPPAEDAVFLRRAFLDSVGRLPSAAEAGAFLHDGEPDARDRLVNHLVGLPEFADFWALKWADLLRNEEKTMGAKGVWVFQRWLRDAVARDLPLDEFASQLLTSTGSTWKNPPASFYRTNRDPATAAETLGQVFLGVRLQCARCHNHPFDVWTQDDYFGLAACFGNVRHKEVNNLRRDNLDKHEINGDEIIYLSGRPEIVQPRTGRMMEPKAPRGPEARSGSDSRVALASWLTRDNPQFARNMANRVWYHLLGRGIVDPVDDFRDSNPPANPALLDSLAREFVASGMRLRPLVALVMKSRTYQLASHPNSTNRDDESNFSRATVRLLPAEVLFDAIGQALEKPESFANAPRGSHAVQLPGARSGGTFLKTFGKPDRLLTCECERSEATTLAQAFQLINGEAVRRVLEAEDNRIGRLLQRGAPDATILEEVYLATLSREPSELERKALLAHVAGSKDRRKSWEDACWAILNSKEFLLRH